MTAPHTPGPWRWEFNREHRNLHLVGGGQRQYDLTIMDFDRWGMNDAVATLRDPAIDGMNVMHKLPDRPDWIAPFPGREHHADWCAAVRHPDMRLIEAAPDLLAALQALRLAREQDKYPSWEKGVPCFKEAEALADAAIAKATGATP